MSFSFRSYTSRRGVPPAAASWIVAAAVVAGGRLFGPAISAGPLAAGEGWAPPPGLQGDPALALDADTLSAVWVDGREGAAGRLYWSRGPATSPDTGAVALTEGGDAELRPALAGDPGWRLAVWEAWGASGARIMAAELPAGDDRRPVVAAPLSPFPGPAWRPAVAVAGDVGVLLWEDERVLPGDIHLALWDRGTGPRDPGGEPLATGAGEQRWPAAAASGSGFLVVWGESGPAGSHRVMARPLDPSGEPAGPARDVSGPEPFLPIPHVAWAGDRYLVVWRSEGAGEGAIAGRFLQPDGHPADEVAFRIADSADLDYFPRVARGGEAFVVVWQMAGPVGRELRAAWIGPNGSVRPPEGLPLTPPTEYAADPCVAGDGIEAAVAVAWRRPLAGDEDDLFAAVIRPGDAGGPPAPFPLTLVPAGNTGAPGGEPPPALLTAFPNPFRGEVALGGEDVRPGEILVVFDVRGRRVRELGAGPGGSGWRWDGRDASGARVPAGIYLAHRPGGGGSVRLVRLR